MQMFSDGELATIKQFDLSLPNNEEIEIEYEQKFLLDLLATLKMFNRDVYNKMQATAEVCSFLGGVMGIYETQFYLASYYANIGFLGMPHIMRKQDFLTHEEKKIVHLHTMYGMEFMRARNLNIGAYLVYMHHELPNGKGYHKEQKLLLDAPYLIHIADSFIGMVSHKSMRPAFSKNAAINTVLYPYEHYDTFDQGTTAIRETLRKIDLGKLGL